MANTTNFGWETPDDTDLVKDGAAAMRTLGNSIDSSFVDLKGGTTGQILSKNSNTDLDYIWINNDQGDITAVTAGTGISGGGTSGAVTITNSMATEITASGDIIVGTGSGTFDNLPIGTTGQVLTADTTVSPYKVKWATLAASSLQTYQKVILDGVNRSTTSTSFTPINTSQYRITATPVSTYAIGFCQGFSQITNSSGYIGQWRISCGAGTSYGHQAANQTYGASQYPYQFVMTIITGLTAGTSYNFDWEWTTSSGSTLELVGDTASLRPKMVVIC